MSTLKQHSTLASALVFAAGCGGRSTLKSDPTQVVPNVADASADSTPVDASLYPDSPEIDPGVDAASCDAGSILGPEGCAPIEPPRLIAPLSTATVTSHRPTLRWQLAEGSDGARVEICRDRACTNRLTTFETSGGSGQVPVTLPAGVSFWRAYGRARGVTGLRSTPTWQFVVGVRSAPVDSSWGNTLDVNGDGYADVVVGAPTILGTENVGSAFVYLGGAAGLGPKPATRLAGPGGARHFGRVASAGDVNGDGYADVIVGAPDPFSHRSGRVHLYLGSASGLHTSPAATLFGPDDPDSYEFDEFGSVLASAGDVNGDGYADIIVGRAIDPPRAFLYFGSASGLGTEPDVTLLAPDGAAVSFGQSVASAGDVNADGYADVSVGAHLYLGNASGVDPSPATTLWFWVSSVASAGDVNGDGYADVLVGGGSRDDPDYDLSGSAQVYFGGASGLDPSPATTVSGPDVLYGYFGSAVASAGDVNADGYADVIIGAEGFDNDTGQAHLYFGTASGLDVSSVTTLSGLDGPYGNFGRSVAGAGDTDGDGYADVIIGAYGLSGVEGHAYLYVGTPRGLGSSPAVTFTSPDGPDNAFGFWVARVGEVDVTFPRSSTIPFRPSRALVSGT